MLISSITKSDLPKNLALRDSHVSYSRMCSLKFYPTGRRNKLCIVIPLILLAAFPVVAVSKILSGKSYCNLLITNDFPVPARPYKIQVKN